MAKNCLIYETLNGVQDLTVSKKDGLMTLTGCFGVCGVRNNNKRVYETSNYSKMVTEMKARIKENGGIPGELEHPQQMNITLENVSHKITDINIDENGVVSGTIVLLNTPKGQIAQAIVEGGLPLFISSRATGNVDKATGNVTLERISTYDLVGTPGFSQARLHLNENQVAESINESIYYISESNENNIEENMELKELLEKFEALEQRVEELETANEDLQEQLDEALDNKIDIKRLADGIQKWIIEEYSPEIEKWITEEYSPEFKDEIVSENSDLNSDSIVDEAVAATKKWMADVFAPKLQGWIMEEYSPEVEKWCKTEFAQGIQNWVIEEFSPEVENWLHESYSESVKEQIEESKKDNLDSIESTLTLLESIKETKPTYSRKSIITEGNADEPIYIQKMPAEARVKWNMASNEVKESIHRRAKIYNFVSESSIERFWNNIDFDSVKPTTNIYEGLEKITDEGERKIRQMLRSGRFGRKF